MRVFFPPSTLSAAVGVAILPAVSMALNFPTTCLGIKDVVLSRTEMMVERFQNTVCSQNCKPTLSLYEKLRQDLVIPAIDEIANDLDIPQHAGAMISLGDSLFDMATTKCESKLPAGGQFCEDPSKFKDFAFCMKSNAWLVVLTHALDFWPLLQTPLCTKEIAYLDGPKVWDVIGPAKMEAYVQKCQLVD